MCTCVRIPKANGNIIVIVVPKSKITVAFERCRMHQADKITTDGNEGGKSPTAAATGQPIPTLSTAGQATVSLIRRIACVTATVYMCSFWTSQNRADLFQYHPLAMTTAFLSAMPEALTLGGSIRRAKTLAERRSTSQFHLAVSVLLSLLTLAGYIVIFVSKSRRSKPHLATWHGLIGFFTVVMVMLQASLGATTYYRLVNGNVLSFARRGHKYCAAAVLVLGSLSMWLGMQSNFANGAVASPSARICFGIATAAACVIAYLIE